MSSIETITIIYYVAECGEKCWIDEGNNNSFLENHHLHHKTPHAYDLQISSSTSSSRNKEIYLYDILASLKSQIPSNLGCSYRYIAYLNPSFSKAIALNAPSSVVPVLTIDHKNMVFLHLFPSSYPPIAPLSQAMTYASISRYQLYSAKHAATAEQQLRSGNDNSNIINNKANKSPLAASNPSPSSSSSSAVDPSNKKYSSESNVSSKSSPRPPQQSPTSNAGYDHHNNNSNNNNSNSSNKDDVAAMAEAAKEVAGAAARSFFSFAASTIKNVSDLAASSTAGASIAGAMGGSLSAMMVGKTKVVMVKELADGGFGKVYLVQDASTPAKQYAMKQMHCQTGEQEKDAYRELQALQKFGDHASVIHLIDSGMTTNKLKTLLLLFPLCSAGSCYDAIMRANPHDSESSSPWPFPEVRAVMIMYHIADALAYMHDHGFTHRDVKVHNILLSDDYRPLLTDFGSINQAVVDVPTRREALMVEDEASIKTSAPYRSPELTQVPYPITLDDRVDVWSIGCCLYCLAFGWSPFESKRGEGVLRLAIVNGRFSYPTLMRMRDCYFSNRFKVLVDTMLTHDMQKRPHSREVVRKLAAAMNNK